MPCRSGSPQGVFGCTQMPPFWPPTSLSSFFGATSPAANGANPPSPKAMAAKVPAKTRRGRLSRRPASEGLHGALQQEFSHRCRPRVETPCRPPTTATSHPPVGCSQSQTHVLLIDRVTPAPHSDLAQALLRPLVVAVLTESLLLIIIVCLRADASLTRPRHGTVGSCFD
jgi:hypothetical protein